MLSVEAALALISQQAAPLAPRRVSLREAAGLVLAEDISSDVNSPPYDKAMMDGYAVVSSARQATRQVIEEIAAGATPLCKVLPGTAARIMTGAPLPEGADAVVPIEKTECGDEGQVRFDQVDAAPGQNVLPFGVSLRVGDIVLRRGTMIRPIEIAILAEVGRAEILVQPRPRVALLPTGNELVSVDQVPAHGQIRNSNGPLLVAAGQRAGAEAVELEIARDTRDELRRLIAAGLKSDVLVLSGGVSAGKFDLVPAVLAEFGVEQIFHKVDLRPGKPLWFGIKTEGARRVLVFGLPGNPVSSFVCFELFVHPTIAALAGRGFRNSPQCTARLSHAFDHPGGRAACLPARMTSGDRFVADAFPSTAVGGPMGGLGTTSRAEPQVEILPWHGSADLAALANANCLARLPGEAKRYEIGSPIDVLLF